MCVDVFAEIRRLVKPQEVAERYGFTPNRQGFICCPFHHEKTPSLKLYPDSWYCFGCKAGGSVIDFVERIEGYSEPIEAVKKLIADFHLPLSVGKPLTVKERKQIAQAQEKRQRAAAVDNALASWIDQTTDRLAATYRTGHLALMQIQERQAEDLDRLTAEEALAIRLEPEVEWMLDELTSSDIDRILEVLRTYGKEPLQYGSENERRAEG